MVRYTVLLAAVLVMCFSTGHASDGWDVRVAPYYWFTAMSGKIIVGGEEADFDASYEDISELSNFGLAGRLELWRGKWGGFFDGVYADLEDEYLVEQLEVRVAPRFRMYFMEFGVSYALGGFAASPLRDPVAAGKPQISYEIYGGLRYNNVKLERTYKPGVKPKESGDEGFTDPIVGGRISLNHGTRFVMAVRGDVGGFGLGSRFAWNLLVSFNFRVYEGIWINVPLRIYDVDFEEGTGADRKGLNARIGGPAIGLTLRFD
jgi:hypothetical protein